MSESRPDLARLAELNARIRDLLIRRFGGSTEFLHPDEREALALLAQVAGRTQQLETENAELTCALLSCASDLLSERRDDPRHTEDMAEGYRQQGRLLLIATKRREALAGEGAAE